MLLAVFCAWLHTAFAIPATCIKSLKASPFPLHPSACTHTALLYVTCLITPCFCNLPFYFLSHTGFTALPHPHRRDHAANPRTYSDIIKPHCSSLTPPKLTCADLPPRSLGQQALSPQLRRLEQHQRQLLELQHRREQQSRPLEEAEQERKRREEEEQRRKKEEAEEEIKRNREEERKRQEQAEEEEQKLRKQEELKQRRDLELQLQQQQEDLKQRQQIMQWQQELQQSNKGQTVVLSPSSGLCTIYEALENSDEEEEAETEEEGIGEMILTAERPQQKTQSTERERGKLASYDDKYQESSETPLQHALQSLGNPSQDEDCPSPCPPESPKQSSPPDLDWGKKVDIVQQLINQTLLLNRDGCSSMLLLPGGAGGTLSPLESSLWPSLLPPLTPPSATVTSVSSFSPETTGTSPQGEWTVVELETHHWEECLLLHTLSSTFVLLFIIHLCGESDTSAVCLRTRAHTRAHGNSRRGPKQTGWYTQAGQLKRTKHSYLLPSDCSAELQGLGDVLFGLKMFIQTNSKSF